jgi:tRNA (adenine57-N1/adenine58-N1)-methyltransferase catalytic subunit
LTTEDSPEAKDEERSHTGALKEGERVLLIDRKDRRYLIRLSAGATFQTHAGVVAHDEIIGGGEGVEVAARRREGKDTASRRLLVLRPTLSDLVVKMPRGAQVIYPKDLGTIIMKADLYPGARVLEAGVGSGALSMVALRAGCVVVGYEIREDFAERARSNVAAAVGTDPSYRVEVRDVYDGIDEKNLDRVLLDLPEPWRALPHAEKALRPGGILLAYLPSINQTADLRAALAANGFGLAETIEVLQRSWHIEGRSVRPDHRMVAHTGFLTTARRLDLAEPIASLWEVGEESE